jgi:hypothetical protein
VVQRKTLIYCHVLEASHELSGKDERFLWIPQTEDILPVYIVAMELNFNVFPDDATCFWKVTPCSMVMYTGVSEELTVSIFKVEE